MSSVPINSATYLDSILARPSSSYEMNGGPSDIPGGPGVCDGGGGVLFM